MNSQLSTRTHPCPACLAGSQVSPRCSFRTVQNFPIRLDEPTGAVSCSFSLSNHKTSAHARQAGTGRDHKLPKKFSANCYLSLPCRGQPTNKISKLQRVQIGDQLVDFIADFLFDADGHADRVAAVEDEFSVAFFHSHVDCRFAAITATEF